MENVYCVIMAGGVGSRFWPLSTGNHPKQFIDVLGTGETLLQATFRRFSKIVKPENILIVTNAKYREMVFEQIEGLDKHQVLLEPAKRNTAPCIAYATCKVLKKNPEASFIISPSDHLIVDEENFGDCIRKTAAEVQENDVLCTLGIEPHKPSTSYGYIQYREAKTGLDKDIKKVKSFTEKPDLEHAKSFIESGDFLWNSGIFIWKGTVILEAFKNFVPDIYENFISGNEAYYTDKEAQFIAEVYPQCQNESIDYAVMEKAKNVFVLPSSFGWNDLGTWGSLHDYQNKDDSGNVIINKNALIQNAEGNMISVSKEKLVVIDGLKDYIVAECEGRILIVPKSKEEEIKNLVNDVKMRHGEEFV